MKNAEFAILSLIVEAPRHGYNIEQVLNARGMRAWTEVGFSSIYYLLNKLEKQGLVISELQTTEGRGPARKIYSATEEGVAACQQATLDALALPYQTYPPLMLGLANQALVAQSDVIHALQAQLAELQQRRAQVQLTKQAQPMTAAAQPLFSYSLAMLDARMQWLEAYIVDLNKSE